jgi:hypothetical protein
MWWPSEERTYLTPPGGCSTITGGIWCGDDGADELWLVSLEYDVIVFTIGGNGDGNAPGGGGTGRTKPPFGAIARGITEPGPEIKDNEPSASSMTRTKAKRRADVNGAASCGITAAGLEW